MEQLGLVAVVALLAVKEAGVPIPVPGDLLVLGAGAAAAAGRLDPFVALPAIIAATILGGLVQYALVRGAGRGAVLGILARVGVTPERLEPVTGRLRRAGARGVAVARSTPGLRVLVIPSAAIAPVAAIPFGLGLAVGNAAFTTAHFAIGAALGPAASSVVGSVGTAVVMLVVVLAVVGAVGWLLIARRHGGARRDPEERRPWAVAWSDAACPACLALGSIARDG